MSRHRMGDATRLGDGSHVRLGMLVYDIADERHIGRLDAIEHSCFATITWVETGWRSVGIKLDDLRKAHEQS